MKTIIITDASSRIGRATVMRFQPSCWNVAATMRHPKNETELQQLDSVEVKQRETTL